MDILQFDDLSYFKKISLDEETIIIESKCGKYSFYINFKDEVKGVDFYELAIATETSNGFINKSGPAKIIHNAVMDTVKNVAPQPKAKKANVQAAGSKFIKSNNSRGNSNKAKRK